MTTHFSEVNENVMAYSVNGHRHLPEISQELDTIGQKSGADDPVNLTFLTHLIPMTRGILSSCYAPLRGDVAQDPDANARIRGLYEEFYADDAFVQVSNAPPQTKQTLGNNQCLVYPVVDPRTNRAHRDQLPGQPGEGSGRAGRAEHEPDVRFSRGDVAGGIGGLPVKTAPVVHWFGAAIAAHNAPVV